MCDLGILSQFRQHFGVKFFPVMFCFGLKWKEIALSAVCVWNKISYLYPVRAIGWIPTRNEATVNTSPTKPSLFHTDRTMARCGWRGGLLWQHATLRVREEWFVFRLTYHSLFFNSLTSWGTVADTSIEPLLWVVDHFVRYLGPVSVSPQQILLECFTLNNVTHFEMFCCQWTKKI